MLLLIVAAFVCQSFTLEPTFDFNYENDAKAEKYASREFNGNGNTQINVSNSHGNIKVVPWTENKVKIDVFVKYEQSVSNKKDYAQKSFSINMSQKDNIVSVSTNHRTRRIKHTINYVIYTPSTASITANNSYGDIALGNLNGYISINLEYGDLFAEKLGYGSGQKANKIKIAYGDAVIKEAAWLNASVEYGSFAMQSAYALGITGSYSDFKIDNLRFANVALAYSDIKIGTINSIKGKISNGDFKTDRIKDNMVLSLNYTDIIVYSIDKNFTSLDLNTSYSNGKLTFDNDASFNINASAQYSSFKLYNMNGGAQTFEKSFSKSVGTSPSKKVRISSQYGDWTLRKN